MRCNASSLGMQRGNQGHRAKNGAHVARDAFSQRCDRTDGAVERRGELQRPCRFPIKQMPAGNSSNPSSQPCFVSLSLSLSQTVCRSSFNRRRGIGGAHVSSSMRNSNRGWLLAGVCVYIRSTFHLSSALHTRESLRVPRECCHTRAIACTCMEFLISHRLQTAVLLERSLLLIRYRFVYRCFIIVWIQLRQMYFPNISKESNAASRTWFIIRTERGSN